MSPSLKYLMVWSIAARNSSSDPMSLTATLGVEVACVLLVMCGLAPDADRIRDVGAPRTYAVNARDLPGRMVTSARPGGRREVNDRGSGDRGGPHEDTAQRSEYEVLAGR